MTEKIIWGGMDAFIHMLIVGPIRSGKTATLLKPIIYNILLQKKRGKPVGLTVVEPWRWKAESSAQRRSNGPS